MPNIHSSSSEVASLPKKVYGTFMRQHYRFPTSSVDHGTLYVSQRRGRVVFSH